MNTRNILSFVVAMVAFSYGSIMAQGTGMNNPMAGRDTMTLTQKYKAELDEMSKPDVPMPKVEDAKIETDGIQYEEKKFEVKTSYSPPEARVVEPKKPTWPQLYNNLVKVGYGRFGTILGKVYLHNGRNTKGDVGLDFTHLSSSNTSSGYVDYAEFREDYGNITAKRTLDDHTAKLKIGLYNTSYFYFADTILAEQPDSKDSLSQGFTKFDITAGLMRNYAPSVVMYDVDLGFKGFFDKWGNKDLHVSALPKVSWTVSEQFDARVDGNLTFSNTTFNDTAQSRFFLDITPTARFHTGPISVNGGLKITSFSDTSSTFKVFPILNATFLAVPDMLTLSAGIQGEMHYYNYYDQITENRYLAQRADIKPGIEKLNVFVAADGKLAEHFTFGVKGYMKKVENQLMYFAAEDASKFLMVYDSNFRQTGAQVSLGFNKDDKIMAGIRGEFRGFKTGSQPFYYGMPKTKVDFYAGYNFADKVLVNAEVYLLGGRTMTIDTAGNAITQSAVADVNLAAEYRFSKRFSIFLNLNNLLGSKYARWYNYQVRPFDVKGGLTVSF